jgi:hypothetical protein
MTEWGGPEGSLGVVAATWASQLFREANAIFTIWNLRASQVESS